MKTGSIITLGKGPLAAAALALGLAVPAAAQTVDGFSREVVQPLPPQAAADLSAAMKRLGTNPQDGNALLQAGWAAVELDNFDVAMGFFSRAEAVPSAAAEAKAGMGAVLVNRKRPVEAIQYFNAAEAAGARLGIHAAQRGLAYDLVGDNGRAQDYYRESLQAKQSNEVTQWLALSQAIGGNQAASDATLLPLLQHRDLASYRTRAFALAALGKTEEAVSIANTLMPATLASKIGPYLRYMPKLTKAQQAAAGIFGHFPEADAIGRDDPRIAEYASGAKPVAVAAALGSRLTPAGQPLGEPPKPVAPPPATVVAVAKVEEPRPSFSLTPQEPVRTALPEPIRAPVPEPVKAAPPPPARLADAFAEFSVRQGAPATSAGAVDITKIEPAREMKEPPKKKEEAKKPAKPVIPSRIWVQVASGRDRDALGFDWRRFTRENSKQFASRKGYVVKWGKSNRLVTGPFPNQKDATSFVSTLKKAGITAFTFTSEEGEAVDPAPGT